MWRSSTLRSSTCRKNPAESPAFHMRWSVGRQTVRHSGRNLSDLAVRNEAIEENV
jgi:hypothetical protein